MQGVVALHVRTHAPSVHAAAPAGQSASDPQPHVPSWHELPSGLIAHEAQTPELPQWVSE